MTLPTSAPTKEAIERLRAELNERLLGLADDEIVGAQLGTHLNRLLSPASYKSWLSAGQNLRSFAESYLVGLVSSTGRRKGLDYVYAIEGKAKPILQTFNGDLWKAFCSTRPVQKIAYDGATSTLSLLPLSSDATEGHLIASLSQVEHQVIREGFIAKLGNGHRAVEQLQVIASNHGEGAYTNWVGALKAEPGLFREWGIFRVESIKAKFAERLSDLALDEPARTRLLQEFEADYLSQRKPSRALAQPISPQAVGSSPAGRSTDSGHRDLLMRAIASLTDEQLARILVPLDLVAAIVGQRKQ
ncbi:MAG: hypothetical protein JNL93_15220 [Pelomonas sp.]|nr:hypothetical protein [Roseateles sp.]